MSEQPTREELLVKNQQLHDEIGVLYDRLAEIDPSYCQECGSCGETGCCPPTMCETVKTEMSKCMFGEYNLKDYRTTCCASWAGERAIKHILKLNKESDPYQFNKVDVVSFLNGLHELLEKLWDVRVGECPREQVDAQCKAVEDYITKHCGEEVY